MPRKPIYLPVGVGLAALEELEEVPWATLDHAYTGAEGSAPAYDVQGCLAELGDVDPAVSWNAKQLLYTNIFHDRTVYEATAYAVPFLAAVAADGSVYRKLRNQLVILLCDICLSAGREARDGTSAGAWGEDVADLINEALLACAPLYAVIAERDRETTGAFAALTTHAVAPTLANFNAVGAAIDVLLELAKTFPETPEPPRVATPAVPQRYRHATFGDATLVRRQDATLTLRFDDGTERRLREQFVTPLGA